MAELHLPNIGGDQTSPTSVLSPPKTKIVPDNQIYEGHKFYWKQRLNVDLNILHHKESKTYEILAYDSDKDIELKSIFLNEDALLDFLKTDLWDHVTKTKHDIAKDRFKKAPPDEEITKNSTIAVISQFIVSRLVAFVEDGVTGVRLSPLSGE